jgi:hypothetical protein
MGNSELLTQVVEALFYVAGRRTLSSYSIQVIKTVVKKLEPKYDFLRHVEIEDALYSEGGMRISTDHIVDSVDPVRLSEALDDLIRVVYIDLLETVGDDVGLFFVSELKARLGEHSVEELMNYGVNFDKIQGDQHKLYREMEKKPDRNPHREKPDEPHKLGYSWDTVSTWKYDNNVCLLYDGQGTLLDKIELDLVIEDYVRRVTEFKESTPPESTMYKISGKEDQFLELLHDRDVDVDSAIVALEISRQKLNAMIQKLIRLEMLEYISDKEIKLTQKGLEYLTEKDHVDVKR